MNTKRAPNIDMAQKLVEKLAETGLRDSEIAAHFGVQRQAVNGWKTNGRIAKQHIPKLAKLTNTTVGWWVGDEEEPMDPLEKQLLDNYRKLGAEFQNRLLLDANMLVNLQNPEEKSAANPFAGKTVPSKSKGK